MASEHIPDNSALKLLVQRMPHAERRCGRVPTPLRSADQDGQQGRPQDGGVTCCVSKRIFHELFPGVPGEGLRA